MADVHDKKTRSFNMSRIRSKDTKPEMAVRKYLHALGFRYRLHNKNLPGKPDIYLKKYNTAILIHGCFWHGHAGCRYFILPKTRSEWWKNKIDRNILNDSVKSSALHRMGINVITIWECDLKKDVFEKTMSGLVKKLRLKNGSSI